MTTPAPERSDPAPGVAALKPNAGFRDSIARERLFAGRPRASVRKARPRILHVGNIANNAYNNAKLLNSAGFDNDVICYDYYHVMGCPEWEDADFSAEGIDHFVPAWRSVDVGTFRRPRWFAQGPQRLCIAYLVRRAGGRRLAAAWTWRMLEAAYALLSRPRASAGSRAVLRVLAGVPPAWGRRLRDRVERGRAAAAEATLAARQRFSGRRRRLLRGVHRLSGRASAPIRRGRLARLDLPWAVRWWRDSRVRRRWRLLRRRLGRAGRRIGRWRDGVRARLTWMDDTRRDSGVPRTARRRGAQRFNSRHRVFRERVEILISLWNAAFPHRVDTLTVDDLEMYEPVFDDWRRLLPLYDVVVAYSTDPILPLLVGVPYVAFEHGTLREIPAENSSRGRCTALSYACAEHVFVTNADCLANARALCGENVTLINHPFDEDHCRGVTGAPQLRAELSRRLDADFLVFFPTRQDWVVGTGYADKANDVFLNAFATLRRRGLRLGMVCCEWGRNVEDSKQLLRDLGVAEHVLWVPPMGVIEFERHALASDLVADQFALGAFGGVMFKAMAVGTPICTYLENDQIACQYPSPPPVLNCRRPPEIEGAVTALVADAERARSLGQAGRQWIERYHGKRDTVARQVAAFGRIMGAGGRHAATES